MRLPEVSPLLAAFALLVASQSQGTVTEFASRSVESHPAGREAPLAVTVPPLAVIAGSATWYKAPSSHDAAAGPLLRSFLGKDWRGMTVKVCKAGTDPTWNLHRCIVTTLSDWCLCAKGRRLVDLDSRAFKRLAPLGSGVIAVTVERVYTLPPTDTK